MESKKSKLVSLLKILEIILVFKLKSSLIKFMTPSFIETLFLDYLDFFGLFGLFWIIWTFFGLFGLLPKLFLI